MALKTVFDLIDKIYGKLIDDAFEEAEKMGADGTKALYYMMTTTGLVLFDIKDRKIFLSFPTSSLGMQTNIYTPKLELGSETKMKGGWRDKK